jgi:hypothetical protein
VVSYTVLRTTETKRSPYMIWLCAGASAGAAVGLCAGRKRPVKAGLIGAAAGIIAGSVAAEVYDYMSRQRVPFYTSLSPLYEEQDTA